MHLTSSTTFAAMIISIVNSTNGQVRGLAVTPRAQLVGLVVGWSLSVSPAMHSPVGMSSAVSKRSRMLSSPTLETPVRANKKRTTLIAIDEDSTERLSPIEGLCVSAQLQLSFSEADCTGTSVSTAATEPVFFVCLFVFVQG